MQTPHGCSGKVLMRWSGVAAERGGGRGMLERGSGVQHGLELHIFSLVYYLWLPQYLWVIAGRVHGAVRTLVWPREIVACGSFRRVGWLDGTRFLCRYRISS
jgi:hypothetical protein